MPDCDTDEYDPAALLAERHSDDVDEYDPAELLAEHRGESAEPASVGRDYGGEPIRSGGLDLDALLERPDHHGIGTPEPVARSWMAVLEAADAVETAREARAELEIDERVERAAEARRVSEAVAAGKPAPKAKTGGRDFGGERRHADAVIAGQEERANRARAAYNALAAEHAEEWQSSLSGSLADRHRVAFEAMRTAEAAVVSLDSAIEAAIAAAPGEDRVPIPARYETEANLMAALSYLEALRGPCEAGAVTEPRVEPSREWRKFVNDEQRRAVGITAEYRTLARFERHEDFAITEYTRGMDDAMLREPLATVWA